jgi:hypothetical protein
MHVIVSGDAINAREKKFARKLSARLQIASAMQSQYVGALGVAKTFSDAFLCNESFIAAGRNRLLQCSRDAWRDIQAAYKGAINNARNTSMC